MSQALGYYVYRVLSGLLGLLPEPVMRRLGEGVGWATSYVARDRFRMAMRHQRRVQGPDADARAAARRVFAHYGRVDSALEHLQIGREQLSLWVRG